MPQVMLQEWIEQIRSGEVGSFPTDTVPALTTLPSFADRIYQIKARSAEKPLILMAGDCADLWPYLDLSDEAAVVQWRRVMDCYFPGAVTLVLPKSDRPQLFKMNSTDANTIGVRIPNHDLARKLLRETGPLATTSVNRSGESALLTIDEIRSQFPELYTLSDSTFQSHDINPNLPSLGTPSTVIQWTSVGWKLLRQGAVVFSEAERRSMSIDH
jgi:L-threonylcarbamoyladenylate synthase